LREARIAWHELSAVYERLGETQAALDALRSAIAYDTRLRDKEALDRAARNEMRMELARAASEWSRLAEEDALTGLPNRRALGVWLAAAFLRVRRGEPIAILLLDIDHFKAINDTYGHLVGDVVLREVASLLRDGTRPSDLPSRFGGEEFVVALASTDIARALDIAARIHGEVARHTWTASAPGLAVTVSIGVAGSAEAADPEALLAVADRRLYAAKRAGRNLVIAAD